TTQHRGPRGPATDQSFHPRTEQMMIPGPPISRRAWLRGAGAVAIALPFLDAMIPESLIGSSEAAERTAKAMPKNRFSLLYYPNGLESSAWYPKGPGADYDLTGLSMEPLKRHQKDFLLLGNLSL